VIEYASEKYFKVLYPDIGIETNNGENGGSKDHNIERATNRARDPICAPDRVWAPC